jgi:hypothetical protein
MKSKNPLQREGVGVRGVIKRNLGLTKIDLKTLKILDSSG